MTLTLYAHPFSSYCQKVLIALYENGTPFEFRMLEPDSPASQELEAIWPIGKFPVLRDEHRDRTIRNRASSSSGRATIIAPCRRACGARTEAGARFS